MRILFVLDYFYPVMGGVPTMFMYLAGQLVKRGHEVEVLTTHVKGSKKTEMFKGIRIHRVGRGRWSFMVNAVLHVLRSKEKYDLIQTSTYSAMIPSIVLSAFRSVPAAVVVHEVWSLREMTEFYGAKGLVYFLEQKVLLKLPFKKRISPSLHTKRDMVAHGVDERSIAVVPHGIAGDIFSPSAKSHRSAVRRKLGLKDSDVVCSFVSKPTVFKGIGYLIDAIRKLNRGGVKVKFAFMLSPLYLAQHKRLLREIESDDVLRESVVIADNTNEHDVVAKFIGASDFLVMPSLTEGFGFAAAEAASIGVPVIATRGTSLTEVLDEGANAVFVKPRSADQIVSAVAKLASDRKSRSKMSKPKRFAGWREVADEYVKVYEGAIRKHKEAGR